MQAHIYTIANQKGGSGKTTTAATLAQAAKHRGFKALAIDLDPQGNLSFLLNATMSEGGGYDLLNGTPAADLIQTTAQGIDIIPASWNLATLTSSKGSARRLQRALEPVRGNYDFIFIDTPPTIGELQYNAMQAATGLIIPLLADSYNIQSLYQISDTAQQIRRRNPELSFTGIILTQYDGRSNFTRHVKESMINQAAALNIPYLGTVRAGIAIKEAAGFQESLFDYAPKSKPAADYLEIFDKICPRP